MKKVIILMVCLVNGIVAISQTNPVITKWLQNTTGTTGRHYAVGSSIPIVDPDSANVQTVLYSATWSYIRTKGIPTYVTGPFLDGNPSLASSQNAIFRFPLSPVQNTGTPTATTGGDIGIFINGVAMFDYRDGVSWKNATNALAGGPLGGMGDGVWNRDAVVGERLGFDCSKGHPAMGNYHHHQNPSAFNLDRVVISTVCNLYAADALYAIDTTHHSPLLGFAFDGFPVYGAYGYKNVDGTGGIVRMKSSYVLRSITTRTTYADGTGVTPGPVVNTSYPLGYFREDYKYVPTTSLTPDYLDDHNGRFCVTPEYPLGTYAYFCTVDAGWNSAYPYMIGPTYYGIKSAGKVPSITESVTPYVAPLGVINTAVGVKTVSIYPNPASDLIAIQLNDLTSENIAVELYDITGKLVEKTTLLQGSTIAYFDTRTLYNGDYIVKIITSSGVMSRKVVILK
jgi:YHYH protein/Secretion system C-terminal sorting domain